MDEKASQQSSSPQALERRTEKPSEKTEKTKDPERLSSETRTESNDENERLEQGEADEELEEGEIDERIEEREIHQRSDAVRPLQDATWKKFRGEERDARHRTLNHNSRLHRTRLDTPADDREYQLRQLRKRRALQQTHEDSPSERGKNVVRSPRKFRHQKGSTNTQENPLHRVRSHPRVFLAERSDSFYVARASALAGGLVVVANTAEMSMTFAHNIYCPVDPKEMILWSDASWTRSRTEDMACAAVTYRRDASSKVWSDLVTLIRGPRDTPYELVGLLQALRLASRQYLPSSRQEVIKVFTDYQPAIRLIEQSDEPKKTFKKGTKEILVRIRIEATRLANLGLRLEIHWVKGHASVLGNERADALAGAARKAYASTVYQQAAPDRPELCELRLGDIPKEFRFNVNRREIRRVMEHHSRENVYEGKPVSGLTEVQQPKIQS